MRQCGPLFACNPTPEDFGQNQTRHRIGFLIILAIFEDDLADGFDEITESRVDSILVVIVLHGYPFPPNRFATLSFAPMY
jgi:hypothetical protein